MTETYEQMLQRVRYMSDGDGDVNMNQRAALKYVLGQAALYRETAQERDQYKRLHATVCETLDVLTVAIGKAVPQEGAWDSPSQTLSELVKQRDEAIDKAKEATRELDRWHQFDTAKLAKLTNEEIARERKIGAAEELRRLAKWTSEVPPDDARDDIKRACLNRADELEKEVDHGR